MNKTAYHSQLNKPPSPIQQPKPRKFWNMIKFRIAEFHIPEPTYLMLVAMLIGILTGYAAVGFKALIHLFNHSFFYGGERVLSFLGKCYIVFIPATGGLIVGPLIYLLAREAKGHGVPEVIAAIAEKGGIIRPRVVLIKALASAISIGSGGSVGREGPIVQISSAIGSTLGQILKFSESHLKTLVACGAAGGISATFNAPIGGVLFAQEIILRRFTTNNFVLIVISSVISAVISRIYFGNKPAFLVPQYDLIGPQELVFYLILGILAGLFAVLYIRTLYWFEDLFDKFKQVPEYLKPMIGGLFIGIIGIKFPQVFGVGYDTVEKALSNQLLPLVLFSLLFIKLLATSITIGSGGSGGVFAPGLFMGAMLGGTLGSFLHINWPNLSAPPGAYSLVGMGAVFAAMSHAPVTGIIMLFEMSNDYRIILPLMTACVISTLVSSRLLRDNIYTLKLKRRGLDLNSKTIPDVLETFCVRDAMTKKVISIPKNLPINEAEKLVRNTGHLGYPVTDSQGKLYGIVTWQDIIRAIKEGKGKGNIFSISTTNIVCTWPQESLKTAAEKMALKDVGRLPVVNSEHGKQIVGILTRSDIIKHYRTLTHPDAKKGQKTDVYVGSSAGVKNT